jgi:hypothetical protein
MVKQIKVTLFSILGILLLTGCSSKYGITYNTNPEGASVVCQGVNKGYSPVRLYYTPDENQKKVGSMRTVQCSAYWVSGAKKDFENTWDLNKFPNGVIQTLQRPNVDGYEKDAQFALQVQNSNYQRRQAQAAEDAAYQQSRNANANQQRNYQLQQQNYQLQNINNYMRYGY